MQRCRAGSEAAFAEIVARHEAALRRHCARILGRSAAEDAVQDAFVSAWIALRANASVSELRPWLIVIARRKALSLKRRSRHTSELTDAIPAARSCAQDAAQAACARDALAALAALPETQREALIGSALHGRSGTQLARQLGVTEPTVRQLVFRARDQLRRAMPSCVAPPLAFLRLIRRAAATAGRTATAPGAFAAGTALKAAAVLVVGAAAVGAGETLNPGGHGARPPAGHTRAAATRQSFASARRARPRSGSPGAERRHPLSLSPPPPVRRHGGTGSPATPSAASMPRTPSAVAVAPVRAQAEHGGGLAASPAARVLRLDPAVGGMAGRVHGPDPVTAKTVGPLVSSLVGSATPKTLDAVARALAVTAQAATSAGQTLVDDVPAVVNATTHVAQAVLASAQSAAAALQGAQTVVTGMAAPALTGLEGVVVQSPGATGASGPPQVPGLDGVVQSLGATGVSGALQVPGLDGVVQSLGATGVSGALHVPGLDGVVQSPGPTGASGPPRVPGIG